MSPVTLRRLQLAMAVGGAVVGLVGVAAAVLGQGPTPAWLLRLFAAWCVLTPYWWYAEDRLQAAADPAAREERLRWQRHSQRVWLGFVLAMAVPILARGT